MLMAGWIIVNVAVGQSRIVDDPNHCLRRSGNSDDQHKKNSVENAVWDANTSEHVCLRGRHETSLWSLSRPFRRRPSKSRARYSGKTLMPSGKTLMPSGKT
jgi:hypothetical protein